jgi:hypothetical protein
MKPAKASSQSFSFYNDLDAITSASIVGNEDKVFNELTDKIDGMISKI